jgi:hypothetical protein
VHITITFPGDQELELIMEASAIQDSLDLEFRFSIDDLWVLRWFQVSSKNRVLWHSEELDDIENRMDLAHGVGKAEAIGIFSDSMYHWLRPQESV